MAQRRYGWFSRMLIVMTVGGWALYTGLLLLFHYARPEQHFGYLQYKEVAVRSEWLVPHYAWMCWGVFAVLGIAVTAFTLLHFKGRASLQFMKVYLVLLVTSLALTLGVIYLTFL